MNFQVKQEKQDEFFYLILSFVNLKLEHLPAKTLGLKDRGGIEQGMTAGLVILNPETVIDKATFKNPHQYPEGIDYLLINGSISIAQGKYNNARTGKVLRKKQLINNK